MGDNLIAARSVVFVLSQFVTIFNMGLSSAGLSLATRSVSANPKRAFKEGVAYIVISIAIGIVGMVFVLSLSPYFVNIKAYNFSENQIDRAGAVLVHQRDNASADPRA